MNTRIRACLTALCRRVVRAGAASGGDQLRVVESRVGCGGDARGHAHSDRSAGSGSSRGTFFSLCFTVSSVVLMCFAPSFAQSANLKFSSVPVLNQFVMGYVQRKLSVNMQLPEVSQVDPDLFVGPQPTGKPRSVCVVLIRCDPTQLTCAVLCVPCAVQRHNSLSWCRSTVSSRC
jgi:hypothetical protein